MLRVNENLIDQRDIELDLKCFPTLYLFGRGGQYVSRPIKISASEFIELKMMSINSIFRTNSQYLFFLLHESNIRALKAGIYHKLNVSNTKEKLTSSECLKRLENNELEGNLTTIFARLRNTSQYWLSHRSDIEIMITWYGPVKFFLTLSPAEYNWERLDKYLREVNSDVQHGKTTAALIALDPVSTSRIIENEFRPMLDFISSDDGPIGKVVHEIYIYIHWRREYQTRGLQHFHIVIWVDQAPIKKVYHLKISNL